MSTTTVVTSEALGNDILITIEVTPDATNFRDQRVVQSFKASELVSVGSLATSGNKSSTLVRKCFVQLSSGEPLGYQENPITDYSIYNNLLGIWKTWMVIP